MSGNIQISKLLSILRRRRKCLTHIGKIMIVSYFILILEVSRFKRVKQYGENMVGIEMRKTEVMLNKPRYVGAAVLNISKTVMYDFG